MKFAPRPCKNNHPLKSHGPDTHRVAPSRSPALQQFVETFKFHKKKKHTHTHTQKWVPISCFVFFFKSSQMQKLKKKKSPFSFNGENYKDRGVVQKNQKKK